ncbi:Haloacid dehalogenase-like hydrolase-domain-containing protein [Mycena polygramma]|nr:Haloacid dehalogenase-like hydrolase-domain-containing protein [Mycena polygramma]
MLRTPTFDSIIFDLGDVLFNWSSDTKTQIPSTTFRQFLASATWFDYEKGNISENVCYDRLGSEFSLPPAEIQEALRQAHQSLRPDHDLLSFLRELKVESADGKLQIFAMSNISPSDYNALRTKHVDWEVFDRIFTSGEARERKPHLGFYNHIVRETNIDPQRAIFVDDKLDNVISARSLGFCGLVFQRQDVRRALRNLLGDPVQRAREYLSRHAQRMESITDGGVVIEENFTQLLILELTSDKSLVNLVQSSGAWKFLRENGTPTTESSPCDLDTTSIGLTVMKQDEAISNAVMDAMLQHVDADGIVLTYFDHTRPRIDPVVCVNVLTLFYAFNRGSQLPRTQEWVSNVLQTGAYSAGTRYYATAECFLYFVSRLLLSSHDAALHAALAPPLKTRLQERIGVEGDALQLALRIVACASVGLRDDVDLLVLRGMQCEDGGFEIGWIYRYGSSSIRIGNRGLTTVLALKAIESIENAPPMSLI